MPVKKFIEKASLYFLEKHSSSLPLQQISASLFKKKNPLFPKELKKIYNQQLLQGMINNRIILSNKNDIWPHWIYKQLNPNSSSYQSNSALPVLLNTSQRNWTGLSFPKSELNAIVDPKGLISPYEHSWSMDLWIANSSTIISPAKLKNTHQEFNPKEATLTTGYTLNELEINSEVFFKSFSKKNNVLFNGIQIKNKAKTPLKFSLLFAIRPYNPEGVTPIRDITYLTSNSFIINKKLGLQLDQTPDNIVCLQKKDGTIANCFGKWEMILSNHCPENLASAFAEYRITLNPEESKFLSCKFPIDAPSPVSHFLQKRLPEKSQAKLNKEIAVLDSLSFHSCKENIANDWDPILAPLSHIQIPDAALSKLVQKNITHLHSFIGKTGIHTGAFKPKDISIKESYYLIRSLDQLKSFQKSRYLLNTLYKHYKNKVSSLSISSLSHLISSFHHFFILSQDYGYIEQHFKFINRCGKVLSRKLLSNYPLRDRIIYSLFRPKLKGETMSLDSDYSTQLFWGASAISKLKTIAEKLEIEKAQLFYEQLENDLNYYLEHFIQELAETETTTNIKFSDINPCNIPSLIACYPLQILEKDSKLINKALTELKTQHITEDIYFHPFGHTGLGASYNCHLAEVYLQKKESHHLKTLSWLQETASPSGCWPETIHPITKGGMTGDGHHALSHSSFLTLIRNMLVREEKEVLYLASGIPKEWLSDSKSIQVKSMPTTFGLIDYKLRSKKNTIEFSYSHQFHSKPKSLTLLLPKKILEITDQFGKRPHNDYEIEIPLHSQNIELTLEK